MVLTVTPGDLRVRRALTETDDTMTARSIAEQDDRAADILCDWATGENAQVVADWIAAHRVNTLPQVAINAIASGYFRGLRADGGDALEVVSQAQANYGGGSEAADWYEMSDGNIYGVDTFGNYYVVSADDAWTMPEVENYEPTNADEDPVA